VVVAYDGDPAAAHALHAFQTSGIGAGREVHVVSVHEDGAEAGARAGRAVDYLRVHEIDAQARPVPGSAAAEAILEAVRLVDAGLIVMGARAGWPLTEMLFGSVTRAIVERADVAMFLHP
jgi:nucleotide-binding universal stress UspA family protein